MNTTKTELVKGDILAVRTLTRLRDDFQAMRKRMDGRIGRKASGEYQDIPQREFRQEDLVLFMAIADAARKQEDTIKKELENVLQRFPIYTEFLSKIKGLGPVAAGWIVGEYDIHEASTVSKMWQYTGLNPGLVIGKKRKEMKNGRFSLELTDTLVKADRQTPGFVSPFNKRLRTAMVGVMATDIIKTNVRYRNADDDEYAQVPNAYRRIKKNKDGTEQKQVLLELSGYAKMYVDYKARLESSDKMTTETKKGGTVVEIPWKEATDGHRDMAAKRYMVKMFLKDLYVAWRTLEGLPVRPTYQEEYLGHVHSSPPVISESDEPRKPFSESVPKLPRKPSSKSVPLQTQVSHQKNVPIQ